MAIAINPDVRELDFSDNVKVSKFMQDFSDFRAKKWITYRPVNAPSESEPFLGGTRQFIINMGTGHILDTTYSGLWFTLYLENKSDVLTWPLQASLPRTSTAWIESVTFQHSKVAAHIDERLCDYDAVAASFVPAKDVLSMKQTFFTTEGQSFADGNMFNEVIEDDPYFKLFPAGTLTTKRINCAVKSFFIPLSRLSSIFNSGKYFFPSLLRGNGEMTLSIRSVHNSLSAIFGGEQSNMAIYNGLTAADCIWSCDHDDKDVDWLVAMIDMKLVTLNLDNAFLTKEYNAFIASGRKFIRSFKGYNYQFYQVKQGYNRIEIANTHQSISHVILAFQSPYSIRSNGQPSSVTLNQFMGIQSTSASGISSGPLSPNFLLTQGVPPTNGGAASHFTHNASRNGPISTGSSQPPSLPQLDQTSSNPLGSATVNSTPSRLRPASRGVLNIAGGALKTTGQFIMRNAASVINAAGSVAGAIALNPGATEHTKAKAQITHDVLNAVSRSLSVGASRAQTRPRREILTDEQEEEETAYRVYENHIKSLMPQAYRTDQEMVSNIKAIYEALQQFNSKTSNNYKLSQANVEQMITILDTTKTVTSDTTKKIRNAFNKLNSVGTFTPAEALLLSYMFNADNDNIGEAVKQYLTDVKSSNAVYDPTQMIESLVQIKAPPQAGGPVTATFSMARLGLGGQQLTGKADQIASALIDTVLPYSASDGDTPPFTAEQRRALFQIVSSMFDNDRIAWHRYYTHMVPAEPKQIYDLGMNIIESLQVYRGTGNGETVFSEPINENMFYHVSREALGDMAENHPYFNYASFRKDTATITISLNTFMRDAHHEFWDGFSTNRVADRLYVEFELIPLGIESLTQIMPWYRDIGYNNNNASLNCKVFTIYDNIYYIDRDNNLNVSDTLLPLQEGRIPGSD
ncbi:Hypothetical protein GLP15_3538 [Giardia lamblia P15]|uniref:Uncharacterized protein n=1 Tax=Giardia intestinalis (strain P15) TaxID=658858 RepID=E1F7E3_GIAIA|nr:Hypothetical protein GLP15_3538 [Giardia lamblia P15]